jgi:hypothetical protein
MLISTKHPLTLTVPNTHLWPDCHSAHSLLGPEQGTHHGVKLYDISTATLLQQLEIPWATRSPPSVTSNYVLLYVCRCSICMWTHHANPTRATSPPLWRHGLSNELKPPMTMRCMHGNMLHQYADTEFGYDRGSVKTLIYIYFFTGTSKKVINTNFGKVRYVEWMSNCVELVLECRTGG